MALDLGPIKARDAAATRGPWYWGGNVNHPGGIDLRARISNSPIVMAFRRWGNDGGEPCFWKRDPQKDPAFVGEYQRARDIAVREVPYRGDVVRLDNADAEFIAHARTDVPELVAEVEELRAHLGIANEAAVRLADRAVEAEATVQRLIAQADGAARRVAELEVRSLADEVRAAQGATRAARGAWADQW